MKLKRILPGKKLLAVILAAILAFPMIILDTETALANLQTPVTELELNDASTDSQYNIRLNWKEPPESSKPDSSVPTDPGASQHSVEGYNVHGAKGAYPQFTDAYRINTTLLARSVNSFVVPSSYFDPGSVYAFAVEPYHYHPYTVYQNDVPVGTQNPKARMDTAVTTDYELYMTHIRVTASGAGSVINVVWDAPRFQNKPLFEAFDIYFGLNGYAGTLPVRVGTGSLTTINSGTQYSYSITNTTGRSFTPGSYMLEVVPVTNGTPITVDNRKNEKPMVYSIGREVSMSKTAFTTTFSVTPSLYVRESDADNLRLWWDSFQDFSSQISRLESLTIESCTDINFSPAMSPVKILTLTDINSISSITSTYTRKPEVKTYYRLILGISTPDPKPGAPDNRKYENLISNIAVYDPTQELFTPTKPIILYADPSTVLPVYIDLTWEAFRREAYTQEEKASAGSRPVVDRNVKYTVWITDNVLNFSDTALDELPVAAGLDARYDLTLNDPSNIHRLQLRDDDKDYYNYSFNQYARLTSDGYKLFTLEDNKIYYIRIVAERTEVDARSEYAYYSCFVNPIGDIDAVPVMMSSPPLRVKKVGGAEQITQTSITVEWDSSWYEVYDPGTDKWYARVDFAAGGPLFGGDISPESPTAEDLLIKTYTAVEGDGINAIKQKIAASGADPLYYPVRYMNLDIEGMSYELAAVPYIDVEKEGFDRYYENRLKDANAAGWRFTASPAKGTGTMEYTIGSLSPEVSYVIYLRPYIMLNGVKVTAQLPAFVTATTLKTREPVIVDPTVPTLTVVSTTDRSATLRFKYTEGLRYELSWSELLLDDAGKGIIITRDVIAAKGLLSPPDANGDVYMDFVIDTLFPLTTYYFWIRSIAENDGRQRASSWSNPVSAKTTDIEAPDVPIGLGLASEFHVDAYNKENNTHLLPIDVDYVIVEWYKDIADKAAEAGAAGAAQSGTADRLISPSFGETILVRFGSLTGNKPYWFRVKTRLTVTKTTGGVLRYYQYLVQMSPDASFTDIVELVVPAATGTVDQVYNMVKDSEWSQSVKFVTGRYKGEYDGDKNPNMYPLPEKDYEIIYDRLTDTLTLRFRSNGVDAQGNHDNLADQRFISSLIASKAFEYNVNLAYYEGRAVKNRTLELPYSIVKAFSERKITLKITTDTSSYMLLPSFFETSQLGALSNFGVGSSVKISVNNETSGLPLLEAAQSFASPAQSLTVTAVSPISSVKLAYTKSPSSVALKLSNRYAGLDQNIGSYGLAADRSQWMRLTDSYDKTSNERRFTTMQLTTYAAIASGAPVAVNNTAPDEIYDVTARINLKGMSHYDPVAAVPALYLNKIIAAVAKGSLEADVTAELTDEEYNSLSRGGMLVTGGNVIREAGYAALLKLYEVKTKSAVKDYPSEAETAFRDISNASAAYKTALLKAAAVGLLGDSGSARPKEIMTMAEMIRAVNIVLQDSGAY